MNTKPLAALVLALTVGGPAYPQVHPAQRADAFAMLPDWSGYWETQVATGLLTGELFKPAPGTAHADPKPPAANAPSAEDAFVGAFLKLGGKAPYKPEWEIRSRTAASRPHPFAKACGGSVSFPAMMEDPTPDDGLFQLLVTPEETLLLTQLGGIRHILTDGRTHPNKEDLWPTDQGDSIGHWEGPTLVVDTIARQAGPIFPIGVNVADLSAQAHFTERLTRIDANTLQDDMTIDDPGRFVHPWKISIRYDRVTDVDRMIPINCEHDRNPVINGKLTIAAP